MNNEETREIIHLLRDADRSAGNASLMDAAAARLHELSEMVRFYEDRLRPVADSETGATEDEIDRMTLALELTTQDKKRFAANLYDLQHAIIEAIAEIEAEISGGMDAAYRDGIREAVEILRKHTEAA